MPRIIPTFIVKYRQPETHLARQVTEDNILVLARITGGYVRFKGGRPLLRWERRNEAFEVGPGDWIICANDAFGTVIGRCSSSDFEERFEVVLQPPQEIG